jgi:hypothetical protein
MFHGPLLPLSPDVTLSELLGHGRPPGQIGAWIRGGVSRLHIHKVPAHSRCSVLASADLGFLLKRCVEVAVREGDRTIILASEMVIEWRALQVATATPYLPGLARLQALFPGLHAGTNGFLVPVPKESPEEVLALCVEEGVRVTGSQIVYSPVVAAGGHRTLPGAALRSRSMGSQADGGRTDAPFRVLRSPAAASE